MMYLIMKDIRILMISKSKLKKDVLILMIAIGLIYVMISLYFVNHCMPNTSINGAEVSFKAFTDVPYVLESYINSYTLRLIERNDAAEVITAQDIGMQYNGESRIHKLLKKQNPLLWARSFFRSRNYSIKELFRYDERRLASTIDHLDCLNKNIIEPQNAGFRYTNGKYVIVPEIYGNQINRDCLYHEILTAMLQGERYLDLNRKNCYINPSFTAAMKKTREALDLLNKYVSTIIIYQLGERTERLDGDKLYEWLSTDGNLEVVINTSAISDYVKELAGRYNTAGVTRSFQSSSGKTVEVKGGIYGWILDQEAEVKGIIKSIKSGEVITREPIFSQRAFTMDENDIGDTYIELNITKQHVWFYKAGKLIAQGAVVTGNPNRGTPTVTGTYMLNYKQADTQLRGPGYEVDVKYFMPFFGGMGIHDASWRYSFGGDIYKRRGTHGCVNAPLYLAKKIFENIEPGTPVVCYEEE